METRPETPEGLDAVLFVQDESSDASILEKEKQCPTPGNSLEIKSFSSKIRISYLFLQRWKL
jgi:hypothetical protein